MPGRWTTAAVCGAATAILFGAGIAAAQTSGVDTDSDPAHINVRSLPRPSFAGTVTLKPGTTSEVLASLQTVRPTLTMQQVMANPRVQLGQVQVDLRPMISRPGSLVVIANALSKAPSIAQLTASDLQVSEIQQGLVVRSFINYRLAAGACGDGRRRQVEALGLHCATKTPEAVRDNSFSNPADPHFVKDPAARAKAIQRAHEAAQTQRTLIEKHIATLRQQLKSPTFTPSVLSRFSAEEAARLNQMSDEQLKEELANRAETKIEQVTFIPRNVFLAQPKPKFVQLPQKPKTITTDTPLETAIFLAGFTLGNDYEWKERIETSIDWCLIGCTSHYYAEVYAGFSYGFGLRFPIKLTGNYHYTSLEGGKALVTANYVPIDGTPADYAATGLPSSKIFNGQEFVAQAEAHAGFSAHIPVYPDPPSLDFKVGTDFAAQLPAPFAGGNFTPPAANQDSAQAPIFFESVDLLGGMLDFGFAGAKVLPGVEVSMHANSVTLELQDLNTGETKPITYTGQVIPVDVDKNQQSHFAIGDPVYDLSFVVTPGIDARLFVDIDVWSHHWDFPIWLSALKVSLPPGGVKFACHADTLCLHNYQFLTQGGKTLAGPKSIAEKDVADWTALTNAEWKAKCLNDLCRSKVPVMVGMLNLFVNNSFPYINWNDPAQADKMAGSVAAWKASVIKNLTENFAKWHGKDLNGGEK